MAKKKNPSKATRAALKKQLENPNLSYNKIHVIKKKLEILDGSD